MALVYFAFAAGAVFGAALVGVAYWANRLGTIRRARAAVPEARKRSL
jgi:hypothetical protein